MYSKIEGNPFDLQKYSEVGMIEGSWYKNTHLAIAKSESVGLGLTSAQIKLLKVGSVYPDLFYEGFGKDAGKFPYFHGNYNYLANYIQVGKIAKTLYSSSSSLGTILDKTSWFTNVGNTAWVGETLSNGGKITGMKTALGTLRKKNTKTNTFLVINGITIADPASLTNRELSYLVLGICVHMVSDTCAHRSWRLKNGSYQNFTHDLDCDNDTLVKERLACAKMVSFSAIVTFVCKDNPSLWDFYLGYNSWAGKSFRLESMYNYAKNIDANMHSDLAWDIKYMTI